MLLVGPDPFRDAREPRRASRSSGTSVRRASRDGVTCSLRVSLARTRAQPRTLGQMLLHATRVNESVASLELTITWLCFLDGLYARSHDACALGRPRSWGVCAWPDANSTFREPANCHAGSRRFRVALPLGQAASGDSEAPPHRKIASEEDVSQRGRPTKAEGHQIRRGQSLVPRDR
jgi:hypothetical protein